MVFALKGARIKSILEFFWLEMAVEWTKIYRIMPRRGSFHVWTLIEAIYFLEEFFK